MDKYAEHFAREYRFALQELDRLEMLLRDVMWYNFETVARGWRYPWFESYSDCTVELFGVRSELHRKRGHIAGHLSCLLYVHLGRPPLPPEIIMAEIRWQGAVEDRGSMYAPMNGRQADVCMSR